MRRKEGRERENEIWSGTVRSGITDFHTLNRGRGNIENHREKGF